MVYSFDYDSLSSTNDCLQERDSVTEDFEPT